VARLGLAQLVCWGVVYYVFAVVQVLIVAALSGAAVGLAILSVR
jgi:hypothetical protein